MTQAKEQINELESHLEKYGYIRPKGKGAFFFFVNFILVHVLNPT